MNTKKPQGKNHKAAGFQVDSNPIALDFANCLAGHNWSQAIAAWRTIDKSRRRSSTSLENHNTLHKHLIDGVNCMNTGEYMNASSHFCKALAIDKENIDGYIHLAMIDRNSGNPGKAIYFINEAIRINPLIKEFWVTKAECLLMSERNEEADQAIKEASSKGLNQYEIMTELARRLSDKYPDMAIDIIRSVIGSKGHNIVKALPIVSYITRQYSCFDLEEKINWWKAASELEPSEIPNIALGMLPITETLEENKALGELLKRYGNWLEKQVTRNPLPNLEINKIEERKIRIGIVSADFYKTSASPFILSLLEGLDSSSFEIFCLSTNIQNEDAVTQKIKSLSTYTCINRLTPEETVASIRKLKLDVCIDAGGFTAYSGNLLFAWRMATLQINAIGFPGCTFTPNIDLLLSNSILNPEEEWMSCQDLLMVDGLVLSYGLSDCPEIAPEPPQTLHGFINFGTLTNPYKYTRSTIETWAKVLKNTNNSQLTIVRPECKSQRFKENILSEFRKHNIGPERLFLVDNQTRGIPALDCYNKIDVVLDTIPMTGGANSYEALLMGVPIITIKGANYHQRITAALVHETGLSDCIANSKVEYVEIATSMANNINRLREIRIDATPLRSIKGGLLDSLASASRFEQALLHAFDQKDLLGEYWLQKIQAH